MKNWKIDKEFMKSMKWYVSKNDYQKFVKEIELYQEVLNMFDANVETLYTFPHDWLSAFKFDKNVEDIEEYNFSLTIDYDNPKHQKLLKRLEIENPSLLYTILNIDALRQSEKHIP